MAPTVADRPPRAPPVITVILHNNGRDGDALVLPDATCIDVHCADPVNKVREVVEKAFLAVRH